MNTNAYVSHFIVYTSTSTWWHIHLYYFITSACREQCPFVWIWLLATTLETFPLLPQMSGRNFFADGPLEWQPELSHLAFSIYSSPSALSPRINIRGSAPARQFDARLFNIKANAGGNWKLLFSAYLSWLGHYRWPSKTSKLDQRVCETLTTSGQGVKATAPKAELSRNLFDREFQLTIHNQWSLIDVAHDSMVGGLKLETTSSWSVSRNPCFSKAIIIDESAPFFSVPMYLQPFRASIPHCHYYDCRRTLALHLLLFWRPITRGWGGGGCRTLIAPNDFCVLLLSVCSHISLEKLFASCFILPYIE